MTTLRATLTPSLIRSAIEKLKSCRVPPDAYGNYWLRANQIAINGLFGLHRFKARRKSARVALFAAMEKQLAENSARYKAGKL